MKKTITVAVIGCGYWGPNLIRNFRLLPGGRVTHVCDTNEARLRHMCGLYPEVESVTQFEDVIGNPAIDAIAIATPLRTHHRFARAALAAGKHVLVEKPMASSVAECEDLIALAAQQGCVLMAGHTFLYSSAVRKIKAIVDHGDLGDLRYISARRLNLGLFQRDFNVAWDLAPHDIAIILHIMQKLPISVNCSGAAHLTPGIEDVTSMCLNFSGEKSAVIHSSWHDPRKVREMTIVGSERMIVYDDTASHDKIKIHDRRVERPPYYDTFADFHYAYHYGDTYSPYLELEEPLRVECQHFLDCIRESNEPLTSGAGALAVVRILEASSESLRLRGAAVELFPSREPEPVVRETPAAVALDIELAVS